MKGQIFTLKQLRTGIFAAKDQLPKVEYNIRDYIENFEIDINDIQIDNLDLNGLLGVFHWSPVYDKEGNLCKLNYTGNEPEYDDFDILEYILPTGGFVDILENGHVTRHLYGDGHEEFTSPYNYAYQKPCDEKTAELRDILITGCTSLEVCALGNKYYAETNQKEKILRPLGEFNNMILNKNLSPVEIIKYYGHYHEFINGAVWYKNGNPERSYTYYHFFTNESAADEILMNATEIAEYCIKNHTGLGCQKIIEFLEKEK